MWVPGAGTTLADALDQLPPGKEPVHLYLTGPRPGADGSTAAMREWFEAVPAGAEVLAWRSTSESPNLTLRVDGRRVDVRRAADWFGEDATPLQCTNAAVELSRLIGDTFWGAVMMASPAMTGLDAWDRSTRNTLYPPLPGEVRNLIRTTTGQGRIQVTARGDSPTIPGLWHYDTRLAYGAIGSDSFPVTLTTWDHRDEFAGYTPGRYELDFEVPAGWDHVGILPVWDGEGWGYPDTPGTYGPTWADACEVHLAVTNEWRVHIRQRLLFTAGRPLDTWREGLLRMWGRARNPLAQRAIRTILIHGIGSFARSETVTTIRLSPGSLEYDGNAADIVGERYIESDDSWEVTVKEELTAWSQRYVHPEWSAHIWARQRARLLYGPRGAYGALTVHRDSLLGMETDAIYLSADPGWTDDGKPGRMRLKTHTRGPLPTPNTWAELRALRARGEG